MSVLEFCIVRHVHTMLTSSKHVTACRQQAELATTAAAAARLEDQLRHAEEELEAAHGERCVNQQRLPSSKMVPNA